MDFLQVFLSNLSLCRQLDLEIVPPPIWGGCEKPMLYLQVIDFSNLPRLEEEPPQIGGGTVSRSSCQKSEFFLLPKPFSENSCTADSKNV